MSSSSFRLAHPPNPAGQAVTKVVWRVNDAQENQNLDLSECQLMSIPDAIYHLMRNTVLLACNLSSNVLRKIPPKFAVKFTNITELNLSRNHLSTLPDELRDLPDLKRLDISHNSFFSMPRVVFKMTAINSLNAKSNSIAGNVYLSPEVLMSICRNLLIDFRAFEVTKGVEVDVLRLKSVSSLHEVNLEENPLSSSCHQQLKELNSTRLAIKISDIQKDSDDSDSDFEEGESSPPSSPSSDDQKSL